MADPYELNLLRHLAASAYALLQRQVARDLFQKPYSALAPAELKAVHTTAFDQQSDLFHWLSTETLAAAAKPGPVGFHSPARTESTPPETGTPPESQSR